MFGAGALIWGWEPTGEVHVEVKVDSQGRLLVVTTVASLNDIDDVNVPAPTDKDSLVWDAGSSKWVDEARLANVVEDTTPELGGNLDCKDKKLSSLLGLLFKTATELTISTGAITVTQTIHKVDTEGDAASDDLDTINGGATVGLIVIRPAHTDRTVVVKDGTGNIELLGGADITLDDSTDHVMLLWDTTHSKWVDIGGGGAVGALQNIVEDTTPQLGGDLDLNGKNIDFPSTANISDVKDEDNMASDSPTMLATQQSIKAYADTKLADVVADTTPQLGGDLDLNGKNIDFPSVADVSDCKDEDNMASDSAVMLATQQSIKAYADTKTTLIWKDASERALADLNRTATLDYTDLDLTALTSANAKVALVGLFLLTDSITAGSGNYAQIIVRKNGTTPTYTIWGRVSGDWAAAGTRYLIITPIALDADEILEYKIWIGGTVQVDTYIDVLGYWE